MSAITPFLKPLKPSLKQILFLCLASITFLLYSAPYQLRLHPEEKQNIIQAVQSGTNFYSLKKNAILYDFIKNRKVILKKPIIAKFFNLPTLGGQRYMATHNKVRYIVEAKYLYPVSKTLKLHPTPQEIPNYSGPPEIIPVGAPHEN